jgi:hypothetical protein
MVRKNLELRRGAEGKNHTASRRWTNTGGTHDRPLRGDSEIVRGRKSKQSLDRNSHQEGVFYPSGRTKVKGRSGAEIRKSAGLSSEFRKIRV